MVKFRELGKRIPGILVLKEIKKRFRLWICSCFYTNLILPRLLKKAKKKPVLDVVFCVYNIQMWKYDGIYRLMQVNPRFNPIILLNPSPKQSKEITDAEVAEMRRVFGERGYYVYSEVCFSHQLKFPKDLTPDLLFITQPYSIKEKNWRSYCYIHLYLPYYFCSQDHAGWMYNSFLQNIAWKIFLPTKETVKIASSLMINKGRNCFSFGYPIYDEIKEANLRPDTVWKKLNSSRLKIIWAPHFSINSNAQFKVSNFLSLADAMLQIAEKYKESCQFAFKPHPYLFQKLCEHSDWGKEKAEKYYNQWERMENTQFANGAYIDLFVHSDAIIHDCHSFTLEYLYTKKPAMYLICSDSTHRPDSVGIAALEAYYHGSSREDIEAFIKQVLLQGKDQKKECRESFFESYLLPPHGKTVAQNIMEEISQGLFLIDKF